MTDENSISPNLQTHSRTSLCRTLNIHNGHFDNVSQEFERDHGGLGCQSIVQIRTIERRNPSRAKHGGLVHRDGHSPTSYWRQSGPVNVHGSDTVVFPPNGGITKKITGLSLAPIDVNTGQLSDGMTTYMILEPEFSARLRLRHLLSIKEF